MYEIFVAVPPSFTLDDSVKNITLKAGESKIIEIPIVGSPQPKATWQYKKGDLPDLKRYKTQTITNMTCLTLGKVRREESGPYTLTLENSLGKATVTINLTVLGKNIFLGYDFFPIFL